MGYPGAEPLQPNLQSLNDATIETLHILGKCRIFFLSTQVKKFYIARKKLLALCMSVDLQSNVKKT